MYIPYVSCNYKLSGIFTCKLERGSEVAVRLIDRLDASTLSKGKTHNRVTIRTSELGESQQWSWAFEWGNPSNGIGFTVASKWGFAVMSKAHRGALEAQGDARRRAMRSAALRPVATTRRAGEARRCLTRGARLVTL